LLYDQVIIGAGMSGLYLLHGVRRRGLSARCFEIGTRGMIWMPEAPVPMTPTRCPRN